MQNNIKTSKPGKQQPGHQAIERENLQLREELLRLQNQLALAETAKTDLQKLLSHTGIATLFVGADLTVRWFSPEIAPLLGLQMLQIGHPLPDIPESSRDPELARDLAMILTSSEPQETELQSRGRRWYLRRGVRICDDDGQPDGAVVTYTDITMTRGEADALAVEKSRLRLALDAAGMATWEWIPQSDALTLDDRQKQLCGIPDWPNQLNGADFFKMVHPDDAGRIEDVLAKAVSRKTLQTPEFRLVRPLDGHTIWLGIRGTVFFDDAGRKHIFGVTFDTTREKQAIRALQNSQKRLQLALGAAEMGTWKWTPHNDEIIWDERQYELAGIKDRGRKMTSSEIFAMVHPDDLAACKTAYFAARRGEPTYNPRLRIRREDDGRTVWIRTRGAATFDEQNRPHYFGISYDVTAERNAHLVLKESLEWQRAIFAGTLDGIVVMDADCKIHSVNPAAAELFEISAAKLVGQTLSQAIPGVFAGASDLDLKAMIAAAAAERSRDPIELSGVTPRGTKIAVELTVGKTSLFERPHYVCAVRDVTERKRLNEKQRFLIDELDHRVKNILAQFDVVVTRSRETTDDIDTFAEALAGRIQSMARTHSLLSENNWSGASIKRIIHDELAPYATLENVETFGPDLLLTSVAAQAASLTLHELATNAAKYGALSKAGGRVSIHLQEMTALPEERGAVDHASDWFVINWLEKGGPEITAPGEGFGMSVIRGVMAYEVGAKIDVSLAKPGLRCRIATPRQNLTQTAAERS